MLEQVQFPRDLLSWIEQHHALASWEQVQFPKDLLSWIEQHHALVSWEQVQFPKDLLSWIEQHHALASWEQVQFPKDLLSWIEQHHALVSWEQVQFPKDLLSWIEQHHALVSWEQVQFPKDLLSWIEQHHALASWVEALGVIGAIFGAAWIARWQDRKIRRREHDLQTKKAKSVAASFVPILNIIDYDVKQMTAAYNSAHTVQQLRQYQFRKLPSSVTFVLDNAHLLPGEAIRSAPQLLSLRELVSNDIDVCLGRHRPEEALSAEELHVITTRLRMMQELVDEIYNLVQTIHDTPIETLLKMQHPEVRGPQPSGATTVRAPAVS